MGLFFPLFAWAGGQTVAAADGAAQLRDDYIRAYLLVAEPSSEVYSLFGHCALRLCCLSAQMDYCFTFETSTDTRGLIRFVRGAAMGGFMAARTDRYLDVYQKAGRGVTQYALNLTPTEKLRLWQMVDEELAKGFTRHYDYLHTHCTSMIVAVVQRASREPIIYNDVPSELRGSFRDVLFTTSHYPWSTFFWQTVMGPAADATSPLEHKIVPVLLPEVWRRAGVIGPTSERPTPNPSRQGGETSGLQGDSLAPALPSLTGARKKELSVLSGLVVGGGSSPLPDGCEEERTECSFWTRCWGWVFSPSLFFSLLLLLAVGITIGQLRHGWRRLPLILDVMAVSVHVLLSLFLLWLVLFSRLEGTQWNWYLLAFNPLPEIAGVISHEWHTVGRYTLWMLLVVLLLTPFIPQLDFPHALLMVTLAVRLAAHTYATRHNKSYLRITHTLKRQKS